MAAIPFRIIGLQVDKFHLLESSIQANDTFNVRTEYKFGIDKENHVIACSIDYTYVQHEIALLEMSLKCFFDVHPDAFHQMLQDDKLVLQPFFSQYLAMINIGAARGEIHARCEAVKSVLADVVLPPINLTEALANQIVVG